MREFTRWAAVAILAVWLPASSFAQESDRVRTRIERALAEELARLRASIVDTVRLELARSAGAPDRSFTLITEELLRKHATYLASDELEGRQAGYEGNRKAADYIAGVMKEGGLTPVGDKDDEGRPTYFQAFKVGRLATRNCLGLLEGSDAELKKDILVVGAHFDHLGTADHEGPPFQRSDRPRDDDKIWNGADDNGSGTSTLLALIRAFTAGGLKPKRSILFIGFSGEEGGLVGSMHYVRHPIAPITRHLFMLNLDMVGRNSDKPVKIEGVGSAAGPRLRKVVEEAVAATGLRAVVNDAVTLSGGDSDHTPFKVKGVPFTFFFSGLHADYHKVTDHAEKLAYDNMVKVGRTAGRILVALADSEEPVSDPKLEFGPSAPMRPSRALGVGIQDLSEEERSSLGLKDDEGGVRVTRVSENSVALSAGIAKDDVIIKMDGQALKPGTEFSDLPRILNAIKAGTDVDVTVIRGGKRTALTARWDK